MKTTTNRILQNFNWLLGVMHLKCMFISPYMKCYCILMQYKVEMERTADDTDNDPGFKRNPTDFIEIAKLDE